jgi:hypothetical protein
MPLLELRRNLQPFTAAAPVSHLWASSGFGCPSDDLVAFAVDGRGGVAKFLRFPHGMFFSGRLFGEHRA